MSSDLKVRSSALICWLTADCVTLLICAALVKLSVSARSQKTLRLSICMQSSESKTPLDVNKRAGKPRSSRISLLARKGSASANQDDILFHRQWTELDHEVWSRCGRQL